MIHVLVADDEVLEREAMLHILRGVDTGEPLEVSEALNGLEALKLAQERKPDIAFLDIRMPGMDGLDLAKEFSLLPDPPVVILVTAYDYFTYARTALRFGVFDYLLKPASTEDVLGVFWRALHVIAERRKDAARRRVDQTVAADIQKALYNDICTGLGSGTVNDEDVRRLVAFRFSFRLASQTGVVGWTCIAIVAGVRKGSGKVPPSIASREFSRFFRALAERYLLLDLGLANADTLLFVSPLESNAAQVGTMHVLVVVPRSGIEGAADTGAEAAGVAKLLREQIGEGMDRFSRRCNNAGGMVVRFGVGVDTEGKAKTALQTAKIAFNLSNAERPILLLHSAHEVRQAWSSPTSISARAVMWLEEHFMESVGIQDLARSLGLNPSYLSRTLKKELGIGFGETLARIRIAYAKDILAGGASAKEASYLVGFRDQSYFTKVFLKIEGVSPSQYVKDLQSI